MQTNRTSFRQRLRAGFSMAEMVTAIAILGILATVCIYSYTGIQLTAKKAIAQNSLETLNQAIHRFNEANYEIYYNGPAGITEMQILRTLQYRNPSNPATGSPYIRGDWNPVITSSTTEYRIVWTGTLYKLLEPGTSGKGLKVDFTGADLGTPYVFPPNFSLAGK
jgi:prepilin-type N-terminal cleavage/methylation domain-containing protein